jgi:hypothetical protein
MGCGVASVTRSFVLFGTAVCRVTRYAQGVWFACQVLSEVFMRIRATALALVVSSLFWSSPALAQQRHVVDLAVMHQAVADQAATDQQNRDLVLGVLHRAEVQGLAGRLGLNVTTAENAVPTLGSAELSRLAGPAHMVDAQLAGGADPIVVSVTTLLLILIIVILLVR